LSASIGLLHDVTPPDARRPSAAGFISRGALKSPVDATISHHGAAIAGFKHTLPEQLSLSDYNKGHAARSIPDAGLPQVGGSVGNRTARITFSERRRIRPGEITDRSNSGDGRLFL
jgi:hypothetical protein